MGKDNWCIKRISRLLLRPGKVTTNHHRPGPAAVAHWSREIAAWLTSQ